MDGHKRRIVLRLHDGDRDLAELRYSPLVYARPDKAGASDMVKLANFISATTKDGEVIARFSLEIDVNLQDPSVAVITLTPPSGSEDPKDLPLPGWVLGVLYNHPEHCRLL
jgi:hypothetical protein